jgi:hypothetical protein
MNTKSILIVGVAAAALLATGLAVTRMGDEGSASAKSSGPLFPELAARLNDAAKVTITGKDAAFVVGKDGASWGATEKGGYPVQFDRVKQLVVGVSQLETVAPMTNNPAQHGKLELADPTAAEGAAKRVTIEDASGKVLADVLIGKPKQHQGFGGKGALYVRKPGDDQTWEVSGQVTVSADAASWLDREVSKLESARVQRVTVHHPGGEILAVSKATKDDANFKVEGLPEGAQLQWDGVANGLATPLQYMSLDDVQRNEGFDTTGATSTEFACFDGLVVTAKTVDKDGKTWLTLSASVDESLRAAEPVGPPAPEKTDATADATTEGEASEGDKADGDEPEAAKPALKPLEEVRKEADELNAKWGPWVYSIPGYNAANLRKKMSDLLKKEEPPSDPASLLGTEPGDATTDDATTDDGATIQDATTGGETKGSDDETSKKPAETPPTPPPGGGG